MESWVLLLVNQQELIRYSFLVFCCFVVDESLYDISRVLLLMRGNYGNFYKGSAFLFSMVLSQDGAVRSFEESQYGVNFYALPQYARMFVKMTMARKAYRDDVCSLVDLSRFQQSDRILDVGCGAGLVAECLESRGLSRVVAVDSSFLLVREGSQRNGASYVCARGEVLPFLDSSFDGAIASNVLQYVQYPQVVLGSVRRALRSGGTLSLSSPLRSSDGYCLGNFVGACVSGITCTVKSPAKVFVDGGFSFPAGAKYYTRDIIETILSESGFVPDLIVEKDISGSVLREVIGGHVEDIIESFATYPGRVRVLGVDGARVNAEGVVKEYLLKRLESSGVYTRAFSTGMVVAKKL